jgi:hypothetical protein
VSLAVKPVGKPDAICACGIYVAASEQLRWNEYSALNENDITKDLGYWSGLPVRKEIRSCSRRYSAILQSSLDIKAADLQQPENYF